VPTAARADEASAAPPVPARPSAVARDEPHGLPTAPGRVRRLRSELASGGEPPRRADETPTRTAEAGERGAGDRCGRPRQPPTHSLGHRSQGQRRAGRCSLVRARAGSLTQPTLGPFKPKCRAPGVVRTVRRSCVVRRAREGRPTPSPTRASAPLSLLLLLHVKTRRAGELPARPSTLRGRNGPGSTLPTALAKAKHGSASHRTQTTSSRSRPDFRHHGRSLRGHEAASEYPGSNSADRGLGGRERSGMSRNRRGRVDVACQPIAVGWQRGIAGSSRRVLRTIAVGCDPTEPVRASYVPCVASPVESATRFVPGSDARISNREGQRLRGMRPGVPS
jgi:hypothetical protein